jgi:hypothetical protein
MTKCQTGRAVVLLFLVLVLFQSSAALAQETAEAVPVERKVIVWTNPILFVFTWYSAEVEIRLKDNHTVGIGGSYLQTDDGDKDDPTSDYEELQYSSFNVFYRYYPTKSFKGFFIGGQVGRTSVSSEITEYDANLNPVLVDESGSAMLAGVLIGYGWLLGDAQRIGVSIGIGANRLFGGDVPDDAAATLPVVRLINVGIAF